MAAKIKPQLNDELDFKLLLHIVIKRLKIILPIFLIFFIISFLYLRYTQPIYQANAVIQLNNENQANKVLSPSNSYYYKDDLSEKLEQLKSTKFLKRALNKLPLEISYFVEGNVLNNEIYINSPFLVDADVINNSLYGKKIFVDCSTQGVFSISYSLNGQNYNHDLKADSKYSIEGMDISLSYNKNLVKDNKINASQLKDTYFFMINNPDNIHNIYIPNIRIGILSEVSNTVKIMVEDRNARRASDIANAIAEEYQVYDVEKKAESDNSVLDFIDQQLELVYENLFDSERDLDSFRRVNNIDTTNLRPLPTIYSQITKYEDAVINLEFEEMLLSRFEKDLAKEDIDTYELFAIISGSEFQGSISALLISLQESLIQKEKLLYNVTESSGQIESINYQIKVQKRLLFDAIVSFKQNVSKRKAEMQKKLNQYEASANPGEKGYNAMEYTRLERLYSINEQFYNQLIEKKTEYAIRKAGYVSQNVILETAITPSSPIYPNKKILFIGAILAAFIISIIIIVVSYLFYNNVTSINDIKRYTDISILGIVPKYNLTVPMSQLIVDKKPKSLIAESLRLIRANLQFIDSSEGPKILSITSTISLEGKTFIAINLSGIIAFSNKKVLLVDFDMRKPKIHYGFGVDNKKGTSTILSGRDSIEDCINHSAIGNLDFITAGPVPPNPSELILSKRMDEVMEEMKKKYDYVVIDNPPIGLVADAMRTLQIADYPIYIMKANHSKRMFIQNVERLYSESNIKKISCILNAVDHTISSYASSYNRYSFGYGYSQAYGGYYDSDEQEKEKNKWWNIFKRRTNK